MVEAVQAEPAAPQTLNESSKMSVQLADEMAAPCRTLLESEMQSHPEKEKKNAMTKKDSIMVNHQRLTKKDLPQAMGGPDTPLVANTESASNSARNSGSITNVGMDKAGSLLSANKRPASEEPKEGTGPYWGGMNRHDSERTDRLGKEIKSKRERQPNGQKKRLPHKVTFCDQLQQEDVRKPLAQVILVESYKKYNVDTNYNDDHSCCTTF